MADGEEVLEITTWLLDLMDFFTKDFFTKEVKKLGLVDKRKRSALDIARNVTMNIQKQYAL